MISKAKNGKTFLLVMDLDNSMIDLFPDAKLLLSKIEMAIVAARKAGVNVVFVQAGKQASMPIEPAPVTSYLIAPLPMDIIVKRKQVTAFVGNDLAIILRTHNAEFRILNDSRGPEYAPEGRGPKLWSIHSFRCLCRP